MEKKEEKIQVKAEKEIPDWLLEQIQNEIASSRTFIEPKRQFIRRNIEKYIDQTIDDEKIPMNTSYAMINLDLAIEILDDQTPIFQPRWLWDDEIADNLNEVARFDVKEMGLNQMRIALGLDRRTCGASIITKWGWNDYGCFPEVHVKDPLCWLPDPFFDYTRPARFHYFEELIDKECVSEEYGFDEDAEEFAGTISEANQNNINARNSKTGYNDQQPDKWMISVINGYTYYDDELYMVTTTQDAGKILRLVKINPVMKREKEDKVPMSAVVNVKWWNPKRWDPMWVSMLEMIGPKQSAISQLYNLRLIDAKFSTLGQMFLYDINTVQNAEELARPSLNPKLIWVDGKNNPISQAVYPVPRNNILEDSYRVTQEIQNALQLETGINNNQLGVQSQGSQTLWEIKQIQENANLRFGLTSEIGEKADELFWRDIWYRSYKEYFSKTDKKFIRVASSIDGTRTLELTQEDFLTFEDPHIIIESKRKFESERAKMAATLQAELTIREANPNTPRISIDYMRRKLYRLQWYTRADIQVAVPYTPEEMDARNTVKLLNINDMSAATIRDINEDHMTYLVVFQSAIDTEAKATAIEMRKKAYIESWQSQKQEVGQGIQNSSANQMVASSLNQPTTPNQ